MQHMIADAYLVLNVLELWAWATERNLEALEVVLQHSPPPRRKHGCIVVVILLSSLHTHSGLPTLLEEVCRGSRTASQTKHRVERPHMREPRASSIKLKSMSA